MAKLKKRTPVKAPPELERVVQQIYDDLNDVINAVNQYHVAYTDDTSGKPGDLRVRRITTESFTDGESGYTYHLEFKAEEGWVRLEGTLIEESSASWGGGSSHPSETSNHPGGNTR